MVESLHQRLQEAHSLFVGLALHRHIGCPNWDRAASPDFQNQQMPNYGCAVSGNVAAMVADPQDLVHGREGSPLVDTLTAGKAVGSYRAAKPTGEDGLKDISTKKGGN